MLSDTTVNETKTNPSWKAVNAIFKQVRRFSLTAEFAYFFGSPATGTFPLFFFGESKTQAVRLTETNFNVWLQLAAIIEQPVSVEHAIYVRFYNVEQVQSIYVQSLPEVYNIFVFLKQDYYDDELMEQLLDREGEILDLYQDTLFHFHYLPLLKNSRPSPSIPKNSAMILSR